jgi:energy-converting hydrogenase Eha subunit F
MSNRLRIEAYWQAAKLRQQHEIFDLQLVSLFISSFYCPHEMPSDKVTSNPIYQTQSARSRQAMSPPPSLHIKAHWLFGETFLKSGRTLV